MKRLRYDARPQLADVQNPFWPRCDKRAFPAGGSRRLTTRVALLYQETATFPGAPSEEIPVSWVQYGDGWSKQCSIGLRLNIRRRRAYQERQLNLLLPVPPDPVDLFA